MSKFILPAAATIAAVAALSLAAAPSAEARKYHHRHGGVSVYFGGPIVYGGYRHYRHRDTYGYASSSYYRGFEPRCYRWGWVHSRSGKAKWRCVAW